MSALGHSRPSRSAPAPANFVPVLNNVRYASDSDHSRYESELTLWAISDELQRSKNRLFDHLVGAAKQRKRRFGLEGSGTGASNFAQIGPMRHRTTDGIAGVATDH
jgi:hypothetical protein